jgi:TRAP-type C4-dicarboxylate transport system permease small subunit
LPARIRLLVDALSGIVTLFYVAFLIYSTGDLAMTSLNLGSRTPDGLVLFPLQIWIPIGLVLFFITVFVFTVERSVRLVRVLTGREEPEDSIVTTQ